MDKPMKTLLEASALELLATSGLLEPTPNHLERDFTQSISLLNHLGQITQDSLPPSPHQAPPQAKPTTANAAPSSKDPSHKLSRDKDLIEALMKLRDSKDSLRSRTPGRTSIIRSRS